MNLKQYAELNQITLSHAKKLTGLSHWKQEVIEQAPEIIEAIAPIIEDVLETVVEVIEIVADLISQEDKRKSVKGLGTKSPYWSELNA
jgi:hypothetical protein